MKEKENKAFSVYASKRKGKKSEKSDFSHSADNNNVFFNYMNSLSELQPKKSVKFFPVVSKKKDGRPKRTSVLRGIAGLITRLRAGGR